MKKKLDKITLVYFSLIFFLVALFLFFSYARVFDDFEYSLLDLRYKLRPDHSVDENIVIIEIGDDSIEKIGKWPFDRNYHALLVKALKSSGDRTIIFDVFFSEEKEEDEALAREISQAQNVYVPYVFELNREARDKTRVHATGFSAPLIDVIKDSAVGTGFINVKPDMDGKIRKIPPFIEYEKDLYPHVTVLAAVNNLGYEFEDLEIFPGSRIVVGEDMSIPLDEDSSILVNYPAPWGEAFRHYSYVDILQSYLSDVTGQEPVIDLSELEGSVCFVGVTATATPDAHPSPLEPLYPGVGVHTSVYDSILANRFLIRVNRWWNLIILIFMCALTAYVTQKARKRFALFSILLIMSAYSLAAVLFFWIFGVWIDVFYPLVAMAIIYVIFTFKKYVAEIQKREIIEKELSIAKNIQESFLPKKIPQLGSLSINVNMLTALQVGGDLYDIVQLDDERMGIMLGDVSGKGVPAALYMAKVVSVFKTFVKEGTPSEVLKMINDRLVSDGGSGLFVTLTYMIFDTKRNETQFAIGGHLPTILVEPDGNVELLDVSEGMPLGMIEGDFSGGEKKYKPGSLFLLYSDGVTEAMDVKEEMFEQDRLVELARGFVDATPEEAVKAIHKAVLDFAGKAKQHDDITVMAIRV